MHIETVTQPGAEWDAFAEATPGATLGHAAAWAGVLQRACGLDPCYLAARGEDGGLAGILPLVGFRGLSGGRQLISLPYLDSGGVLAASPDAERALLGAAAELARARGARWVELRQIHALPGAPPPAGLDRIDLVLPLEADEEAQWKALGAKVRNQTRKAGREGLRVAAAPGGDLIGDFYGPFQENMRDLGSPVHGRRFFRSAAEAFGERLRVIVTYLGDRPVGGLLAIRFAGAVSVPWASTLRAERQRCPNNLIYWEALRWAIARGAREFDFGRSPVGGGTWRFKKGWGAEERALSWTRLAPSGDFQALGRIEASAWLARLSQVWRRLPVALAGLLGPPIRRHLSN